MYVGALWKYQETDKAILVGNVPPHERVQRQVAHCQQDDCEDQWVPLSQISHTEYYDDESFTIEIPRWLAEKLEYEYEEP